MVPPLSPLLMLPRTFADAALRLRFGVWAPLRIDRHPSYHLSHAQFGEDMLARSLLEDVRHGTYADIGAHHPVYFSNTYHFYRRGWTGLNVDAMPGSKRLFDTLRPLDTNIEACIGPRSNELVELFLFNQPALNTTDPETAERYQQQPGVRLVSRHTLRTVSLGELLSTHLAGRRIDLLNIDIEGIDASVLSEYDWPHPRPRVLIFERHGLDVLDAGTDPLIRRLVELGYSVRGVTGPSFVLSRSD